MGLDTLKVGIDWREFEEGTHTGIQSYLSQFLDGAMGRRPGWRFILFGSGSTVFPGASEAVSAVRMGDRGRFVWDQLYFAWAARRHELDVFLTPYVKVPALASCPVVAWLNDLTPLKVPGVAGPIKRFYFRVMCRVAVAKCAAIITISDFTKRDVEERFGSLGDRIQTVHLGIHQGTAQRTTASNPSSGAGGPGTGSAYILHVSNLQPHKDVWTLLRAYIRLPLAMRESHDLVIVGPRDNLAPSADAWVREHGVADRVRFVGRVGSERLAELYANARLFVFPSLYEGFGLPVLEAMSAGVPVVVSEAASLPEIVGDAGLKFRAGDEGQLAEILQGVLSDERIRTRQAELGRGRARTFTPEKMVEGVIRVIEGAVEEATR